MIKEKNANLQTRWVVMRTVRQSLTVETETLMKEKTVNLLIPTLATSPAMTFLKALLQEGQGIVETETLMKKKKSVSLPILLYAIQNVK